MSWILSVISEHIGRDINISRIIKRAWRASSTWLCLLTADCHASKWLVPITAMPREFSIGHASFSRAVGADNFGRGISFVLPRTVHHNGVPCIRLQNDLCIQLTTPEIQASRDIYNRLYVCLDRPFAHVVRQWSGHKESKSTEGRMEWSWIPYDEIWVGLFRGLHETSF